MKIFTLATSPDARYFELAAPSSSIALAALFDILILALGIFACFRLRDARVPAVRVLGTAMIGLFSAFAIYQLQRSASEYFENTMPFNRVLLLKVILGAVIVACFAWRPKRTLKATQEFALILSPLFLVAGADALWAYRPSNLAAISAGKAAGPLPSNLHRNRVIWIIFDELDQAILFNRRPDRVDLSEFDAFRKQAVYATAATSPNRDTLPALQSLLLGRTVSEFRLKTSDLTLKTEGCNKWQDFRSAANVFSRARAAGYDTALTGWHHPYCRLIGENLSECAWAVSAQGFLVVEEALNRRSFLGQALYLAGWQAASFPFRGSFGILAQPGGVAAIKQVSIETYKLVMSNAESMLANPALNLVLLHIPIPHPPGIWNVKHEDFTTGRSDYVDNLQLANRTLSKIREALTKTGQWDSSTILVTADHPYRSELWENLPFTRTDEMARLTQGKWQPLIPFMLKLPAEQTGLGYDKPFSTVLTADLLLAILKGQVSEPKQAVQWLDEHLTPATRSMQNPCAAQQR